MLTKTSAAARAGALAALATAAIASHAHATSGILDAANVILLADAPASVQADRLVDHSRAHLFTERQSFTLTQDLPLGLTRPGTYEPGDDLAEDILPAGAEITVHFLHWDFPAQQGAARTVTGSVLFDDDREIVGAITTNAGLDSTDALFGAPGTAYPVNDFSRRVELDPELAGLEGQDRVTINPEMSRLDFTLQLGDRWVDQMRIITINRPAVIPAPASAGALALGGLIALRRRR